MLLPTYLYTGATRTFANIYALNTYIFHGINYNLVSIEKNLLLLPQFTADVFFFSKIPIMSFIKLKYRNPLEKN